MPKYKLKVSKVYYEEVVVTADDQDHALEIANEYSELSMESTEATLYESEWDAELVDDSEEVTYEPTQEFLK